MVHGVNMRRNEKLSTQFLMDEHCWIPNDLAESYNTKNAIKMAGDIQIKLKFHVKT